MEERMKRPAVLMFSALIFGSVANAGPTQLPGAPGSPYIGTGIPVQAGWWIPNSDSLNGGGAFNSYVSPGTPTHRSIQPSGVSTTRRIFTRLKTERQIFSDCPTWARPRLITKRGMGA